jgi:hypothetical protein
MKVFKYKLLLIVLLIGFSSIAQVSVGKRHIGGLSKLKKETFAKFKKTETLFVLSTIYNQQEYETILKDIWTVTPFRVIPASEFSKADYLSDKYSIVELGGHRINSTLPSGGNYNTLYTYIDIKMYDNEKIKSKLSKLSAKKRDKKINEILRDNTINIARFLIYPKDDFIHTSMGANMNSVFTALYTEDMFFNYKPGFLRNYFQKVNNLLKKGESYWLYKNDYLPGLRKLASKTLYIPSYMTVKYNAWKGEDSEEDERNIEKIFKKYNYKYEIIADDALSDKIMNGENIYYLRYVRMNAERYLQVVSAQTGGILYRNYMTGFSYRIKPKHIADLNSKIKKTAK